MLALNARFALLTFLCCLSTRSLSPSATAHAAVISRSYESSTTPFRNIGDTANSNSQHVLPWSRSKQGVSKAQDYSGRLNSRIHKVRFGDLALTSPFQLVADVVLNRLQRRRSHHRRSHKTIIIPNDHQSSYLLSQARRADTPQWISTPPSNGTNAQTNATTTQSVSAPKGERGTVLIKSPMEAAEDRTIASLLLGDQHILNASENNATEFYLVNAATSTTREAVASSSNDDVPVHLMMPNSEDSENHCVTFNPNPQKPEPLTVEPCVGDNAEDATSASQASQTFMYNQTSGQIRPTWFAGQDDGTTNETSQAVSSEPSNSTASTQNATSTTSGSQASSTTLTSMDSSNQKAQNVTLIFVPTGKAAAADIGDASQNASSSAATVTTTTTVTVFATGSASPSSTSSASAEAASQSALNVEVFGGNPTLSSSSAPSLETLSSATSSSAAAMDVASSSIVSSSAYPSSSINAAAVASSIVASFSSSMASASAAASTASSSTLAAADISASASSTQSSGASSSTYVAAVLERAAWVKAADAVMTPVSTDPYRWKFQAQER